MATRIKAIAAYCPRVALRERVEMKQLVEFISRSTGLNESGVSQVLLELRDTVAFFARRGCTVGLPGLGTYVPTVRLNGVFGIGHRPDRRLADRLNTPRAFEGEIVNREYIGKSGDELVALWNLDHPDDPVVN